MTSQIRSRIEYLTPTDNIAVFLLHSNVILKSSLIDGFSIRFYDNWGVPYFLLGHPVLRIAVVQATGAWWMPGPSPLWHPQTSNERPGAVVTSEIGRNDDSRDVQTTTDAMLPGYTLLW